MWRRPNRKRPARQAPQLPKINWSRVTTILAAVLTLSGAGAGLHWLFNRPINTVVIQGAFERVSAIELQSAIEPYTRAGFLGVKLAALKQSLDALPWIATAEIRRKWPSSLEVSVTEESPIACWGEHGLLNAAGKIFLRDAEHIPAGLPHLVGPEGTEQEVTARYFSLQAQLEQRGLSAASLSLDARGAWTLQINNSISVRFGAANVEERISRFFQALDIVIGQMASDIDYVDMRYPNGFAVGWKSREQPSSHAGLNAGKLPNA